MKDSLKEGLSFEFKFKIPETKIISNLFPEASEFQAMPKVLATGFMVGLFEWACIKAINPHINWPDEQTVGIQVNLSHLSPTPPKMTVTVNVKLTKVAGKKLTFAITANDGIDKISEGTHERFIINAKNFNAKVDEKHLKGTR